MDLDLSLAEPESSTVDPFQRFFMSIVYAVVLLGVLIVPWNFLRAVKYGIDSLSIIQWILYPSFILLLLFKKRIPFRIFVWLFIWTVWIFGAMELVKWGLLGNAEMIFMGVIITVGICQDKGKVLLLAVVSLLLYAVVGSLVVSGILQLKLNPLEYATSLNTWVITSLTFFVFIGTLADRTGWMFRELDLSNSDIAANNEKIIEEIEQRKETQKKLEEMIHKKDALHRDVHHKVKSNLQVISGLISVQAATSSNPEVKKITKTTEGRIQSTALIHEILYQSEDFSRMNLKNLLENLCLNIEKAFGLQEKNIVLSTSLDEAEVQIENAVPLSLIINEAINNSIIHGFPEAAGGGEIKVALSIKEGREICAEVRDNGKGIGDLMERRASPGMGYDLINIISEEMGARFEVFEDKGTVFRIRFEI